MARRSCSSRASHIPGANRPTVRRTPHLSVSLPDSVVVKVEGDSQPPDPPGSGKSSDRLTQRVRGLRVLPQQLGMGPETEGHRRGSVSGGTAGEFFLEDELRLVPRAGSAGHSEGAPLRLGVRLALGEVERMGVGVAGHGQASGSSNQTASPDGSRRYAPMHPPEDSTIRLQDGESEPAPARFRLRDGSTR
jgi:hypothetical protein